MSEVLTHRYANAHNSRNENLIPSAFCPVTERSRSELVEVLPYFRLGC
jgi:hypothetical protein